MDRGANPRETDDAQYSGSAPTDWYLACSLHWQVVQPLPKLVKAGIGGMKNHPLWKIRFKTL